MLSGKQCELGKASGGARLRKLRTAAPGRGGDARKCGGRAAVVAHAQLVQPAQLAHIARLLLLMSVDVRGPVFRMDCLEGAIALNLIARDNDYHIVCHSESPYSVRKPG